MKTIERNGHRNVVALLVGAAAVVALASACGPKQTVVRHESVAIEQRPAPQPPRMIDISIVALHDEPAPDPAQEKVVGWFQGRMEFGPRALGARSIIGDPRSPKMQATMNLKIKFRESFRPFAPAILEEKLSQVYEGAHTVPFMNIVYKTRPEWRDRISAVNHEDNTGRVQTVRRDQNEFRGSLGVASRGAHNSLRIAPVYAWSDADLSAYLARHGVPDNDDYVDPTKPGAKLESVAFRAPESAITVVVVINRTRDALALALTWPDGNTHALQSVHVTDRSRDCMALSGPQDHRSLQMPPESIVTLTLQQT